MSGLEEVFQCVRRFDDRIRTFGTVLSYRQTIQNPFWFDNMNLAPLLCQKSMGFGSAQAP